MKKANLQCLERTERMMVRWMCGVLLKNRRRSVDLLLLLLLNSHLITRQLMKHHKGECSFAVQDELNFRYKIMIHSFTGMQQDISIFKQEGFMLFFERCQ